MSLSGSFTRCITLVPVAFNKPARLVDVNCSASGDGDHIWNLQLPKVAESWEKAHMQLLVQMTTESQARPDLFDGLAWQAQDNNLDPMNRRNPLQNASTKIKRQSSLLPPRGPCAKLDCTRISRVHQHITFRHPKHVNAQYVIHLQENAFSSSGDIRDQL